MKKTILGIILTLVMLIPFINKIASTADSAQDWTVGIAIMGVVLAFAVWLVVRAERSESAAGPVTTAAPQPPVTENNAERSAGFHATTAPPPVCAACGAVSTGTKFCQECGKLFQPRSVCSECGAQLQIGIKFCPECGRKAG
jgi:ABC-type nickel/cobalt efflux system permease component RcnA